MALPQRQEHYDSENDRQTERVGQPEQPTKQSNPAMIYVIAGIAALGGFLFGYDTGVISGAELYLTKDFALNSTVEEIAISAVLVGAIIGAAVSGRLSDAIGRKITLIIMAAIFTVGAILTAFSPTIWVFIVFRIIVGFGIGMASVTSPIYITEMSPPAKRGGLVTLNQLAVTVGIAIAYWADLAFASANMGWRPMFAVAAIPAIILFIAMFFLSDTPRWLSSKGRWDEAQRVLQRYAGKDADAELRQLHKNLEETQKSSVKDLFGKGLRVALIVGLGLAILQQIIGINTIIYYAPTIFGYAGFKSASGAILATSVVGVVNVISTVVAVLLVDRVGRRALLLVGTAGLAITLAVLGILFSLGAGHLGFLVLIVMLLYIFSFAIGMGPVFWLMSSEVFPTRLRGTGVGISTVGNWTANLLVSVTFLSLIAGIGQNFTFWLYGVFAVASFFFCWFLVPETKGKHLEQIEAYWHNGRKWEDAA
ncbi:MAG: sugar porter family MFS transporter [Ktedonobacteraceae bacterium]